MSRALIPTRTYLIPLLGSLVAFGPMSIDMYLPALVQMTQNLNASQAQMQYTLSAFFVGFCISMLVYGPLSDTIGRRRLLIGGLLIFVISSVLCAFANNVEFLIVLRFFQAFGSSAAIVMARAVARDLFNPDELPKAMSLMTLVTMIAPLIAPTLGGYILYFFDWRAIFIALAIYGLLALVFTFTLLPESLSTKSQAQGIFKTAIFNYADLLKSPDAMGIIGTFAFSFGAMFAFIAGSPFVYIEYFHVKEQHYGYLFFLNVLAMIVVLLINVRLLKHFALRQILFYQTSFQLIAGISLFILNQSNIYVVVSLIVMFISMTNAIGANSLSLLLKHRGQMAGSATALAVSAQFALGGLASFLVSILQDDSPYAMALVMALFALLSFLHQFMVRAQKH